MGVHVVLRRGLAGATVSGPVLALNWGIIRISRRRVPPCATFSSRGARDDIVGGIVEVLPERIGATGFTPQTRRFPFDLQIPWMSAWREMGVLEGPPEEWICDGDWQTYRCHAPSRATIYFQHSTSVRRNLPSTASDWPAGQRLLARQEPARPPSHPPVPRSTTHQSINQFPGKALISHTECLIYPSTIYPSIYPFSDISRQADRYIAVYDAYSCVVACV